MTDFTNTISVTAASIEDLQEDLEAHLEDILGVDLEETEARVSTDPDRPSELEFYADFDGLEDDLEDRLGGTVDIGSLSLGIRLDGDRDAR